MKRRLALIALLVVLVVPVTASAGNTNKIPILVVKLHKRAPHVAGLAPPVPCTASNRMDIFVDEDNILWECTCEMLKTMTSCHWQVIGGVDPVAETRIRNKIAGKLLPRRFWWHARGRYYTVFQR